MPSSKQIGTDEFSDPQRYDRIHHLADRNIAVARKQHDPANGKACDRGDDQDRSGNDKVHANSRKGSSGLGQVEA